VDLQEIGITVGVALGTALATWQATHARSTREKFRTGQKTFISLRRQVNRLSERVATLEAQLKGRRYGAADRTPSTDDSGPERERTP
jgi:hypothetical protein